jgi:hypothetical protein
VVSGPGEVRLGSHLTCRSRCRYLELRTRWLRMLMLMLLALFCQGTPRLFPRVL